MEIIIIGLGNFGGELGLTLMQNEHEVIGVDKNLNLVDKYNQTFTATMAMDTSEEAAIQQIPFKDADIVVVAIGEDIGASITTTALVRKYYEGRLIVRALNTVHKNILYAMNIDEIIEPEKEYAAEFSHRIMFSGVLKLMDLPGNYDVIEVETPPGLVGKNIKDIDAKHEFDVYILTVVKRESTTNYLDEEIYNMKSLGILKPDYVIQENDILLIFGSVDKIQKFLGHFQ